MSIPNLGTSQFVNKYSTQAVRDFLQPRGTLDSLYLISLLFWMATSVFFQQAPILRVGSFLSTILFLILTNFSKIYSSQELSLQGSSIKVFFSYLIIVFLTSNKEVSTQLTLPFNVSYLEFENLIIILVFLFSIILNHIQFNLIIKYGIVGYQVFLYSLVRGIWLSGLGVYFLIGLDILKESIAETTLPWEDYLLLSLIFYLVVSLFPYSYNSLRGAITRKNSLITLRDSAFGASLWLIVLNFFFKRLTFDVWENLLPLMFLASLILFVMKDKDTSFEEEVLSKSIQKTKEMAKKLSSFDFQQPEIGFSPEKSIDVFKKDSSKLSAGKDSIIIPLSFTGDNVAVEVIGDLSLEVKDNLGRIKKELTEKATLMLSKTEWQDLTAKMKTKKLSEIKIPKFLSRDDLYSDLEDSLSNYKEKFQSMGLTRVEDNLELMKGKYTMDVSKNRTEFNFPGIKVIDEPGSQLFNMGPIKVIDIERKLIDNTPAKYFSLKMPFISVTELNLDGKSMILNMPFISVLETPKGMMMKIFGFDVTEGNKQEILGDLDRIIQIQARFNDYYDTRMTNVLVTDENPNLVLTKGEMNESKLLVAGSDDSVFIDEKPLEFAEPDSDILELTEGGYEIVESVDIEVSRPEKDNLDEKLNKLMKRVNTIPKDDFIEYMGFQSNNEFLKWLTKLPDDVPIRVEENIVFLK
jgi:hypothetical protein